MKNNVWDRFSSMAEVNEALPALWLPVSARLCQSVDGLHE
jgi:hypothetical protein